ncbi:MAG TPA: hypothetical protein VM011_09520 [Gammaproteobacteria bacterium]|nr:hypothetical protein [Gammaproteobacteria bacterium]
MRLVWLLVILAVGAGLWFYTNPDAAKDLKDLLPHAISTPGTDRLYKWRNDRGEWQMTDTLPPAGTPFETLDYREDVNVLPVPPQLGNAR